MGEEWSEGLPSYLVGQSPKGGKSALNAAKKRTGTDWETTPRHIINSHTPLNPCTAHVPSVPAGRGASISCS